MQDEEEDESKASEENAAASSAVVPLAPEKSETAATHHGHESPHPVKKDNACGLDFIGPSHAVKDLFAAPYSGEVSVAIHNVDGTLLIDAAIDPLFQQESEHKSSAREQQTPFLQKEQDNANHPFLFEAPPEQEQQQQLIAVPDKPQNDALLKITAILQEQYTSRNTKENEKPPSETNKEIDGSQNASHKRLEQQQRNLFGQKHNNSHSTFLPSPDHYAGAIVPHEPREYVPWSFQNMNLLVGSDALVYRPPPPPHNESPNNPNSQALAIRVADASELRLQLRQHQESVRQGRFIPVSVPPKTQQSRSYADVATAPQQLEQHDKVPDEQSNTTMPTPDDTMMRLHTCIVPSGRRSVVGEEVMSASTGEKTGATSSSPSPSATVCTVVDAYLDNIMTNVPQLALCLYEKGFIQSIKLLQTQDIPSTLMHPTTLDISSSLVACAASDDTQPLFSPEVMEMNASMLLRFLQSNCTRNNATYLLQRKEGQTNIQLYDISSISTQRQRKWMWWLAMMSYRFAVRLGQLSNSSQTTFHPSQQRSFRARQRSLLHNALELLQDLNDRDGPAHETFCAEVCENLADTFLLPNPKSEETSVPKQSTSSPQPYPNVSADALNKAQDYLVTGIRTLWPVLERNQQRAKRATDRQKARRGKATSSPGRRVVVHTEGSSSSSSDSEDEAADTPPTTPLSMEAEAVTVQLLGLHHKLINVHLRLADHHLHNYWSSSAMQALRTAARRIADAVFLLRPLGRTTIGNKERLGGTHESPERRIDELQQGVSFQYAWLWEHCGFFARSFAADELWRDRGHCCGDDVVSLLRDVEAAFSPLKDCADDCLALEPWLSEAPITKKTHQQVGLYELSSVVTDIRNDVDSRLSQKKKEAPVNCDADAVDTARAALNRQKQIKLDERRVLVAACVSYSLAVGTFDQIASLHDKVKTAGSDVGPSNTSASEESERELLGASADSSILDVLKQRYGDACNEIGKILLNELGNVLAVEPEAIPASRDTSRVAADPLLFAAQFWFLEGLHGFEECKDLRNVALLRCNLCQCCKLRANNIFLNQQKMTNNSGGTHAENCLQDAADHLQMAHETMGVRDVDPVTWDMVSEELAATFLVLGVRRRQSLLGSGSTPLIMQAMRLNPGKERSIVDPMERALKIYEQSGNTHQAAAVNYQLALFYSKVWTCQRDEAKTREKLSAAFQHYSAAHAYFSAAQRGNEPTFCILCLDLSNLYAAVSGEECLAKALDRCLDTTDTFSEDAVDAAMQRGYASSKEWLVKMETLGSSLEDRVFKLLLTLVKLEKESKASDGEYKDLYREALTAKATRKKEGDDESRRLTYVHDLLKTVRDRKKRTHT